MTNDHNPTSGIAAEADSGLLEIISRYTQTFSWLQRYDEGMLTEPTGQSGGTLPSETQATALFAQPRGDGLGALLGNLDQTVFGNPAYPTVECKAAHLLYFVVKNHPFSDGNKRRGGFLIVDFLHRNGPRFEKKEALVIHAIGMAELAE